jgi:CcmD family protein
MKKLLSIFVFMLFLGGMAAASQPKVDNEGFEQVNGDMMQKGESIPATALVGAAYGFIFLALLGYVVSIARRADRLAAEADELKRKLEARR